VEPGKFFTTSESTRTWVKPGRRRKCRKKGPKGNRTETLEERNEKYIKSRCGEGKAERRREVHRGKRHKPEQYPRNGNSSNGKDKRQGSRCASIVGGGVSWPSRYKWTLRRCRRRKSSVSYEQTSRIARKARTGYVRPFKGKERRAESVGEKQGKKSESDLSMRRPTGEK